MKRAKCERRIPGRGAVIVVVAVLTGILSLSSSACRFDIGTHCNGVFCEPDQICMPNEDEGICVDIGSCGDGVVDSGEECDDGNLTATDGCDLSCKLPVCGDGVKSDTEICDSGNSVGCGVCSANCHEKVELRYATATIEMSGGTVRDQDTLILDDGINNRSIFKFVKQGGSVTGAHIGIFISTDAVAATAILNDLAMKIQGVADVLLINAFLDGTRLRLIHQKKTALGNQAVISSILSFNTQMTGGAGADCSLGVGCTSNDDCISNFCSLDSSGTSGTCEMCKSTADCRLPLSCLPDGSCGMM